MKANNNITIKNRKASFEYTFLDTYVAGIQLVGVEIKSIRNGHVNLSESYCAFQHGELFLMNTHISPYENAGYVKVDPLRDRKLLLNKHQFDHKQNHITI